MANRKRNIQMKFYVTEDEKRLIDEKMSQLPTRRYGAYLRKMAIDGYIIYTDTADIKAFTKELSAIGRNINQIAKRINAGGPAYQADMDEIRERLDEISHTPKGNGKLLEEELRQREEINELIMTEDAIEMTYHLEHCPNCQQGGIAGALNLVSLMGCNIYDEHDEAPAEDLTEDDQTQVLSM